MPIFILALSQAQNVNYLKTLFVFLIIHVVVYPSSNGYNSYIDKDETAIGGIEKPPLPTIHLFYLTLFLDGLTLILSALLISNLFCVCILFYILASRAYSSKQIRLKKYAILGFLTVVIFQGAFTYFMCNVGVSNLKFKINNANLYILMASSFQIAGAYPLTQVYQHQADLKDGVKTISYKLGCLGTFYFTATMFVICNVFYFLYFNSINKSNHFVFVQLCFLPILIYFFYWLIKVYKSETNANFKNTMRMNLIAAICMNTCFGMLLLLNSL